MDETKVNPPQQTSGTQPPVAQPPANQPEDELSKLAYEYERLNKSAGDFVDEWRKTLSDNYKELQRHCEIIKSYSVDKKENFMILKNFKLLEPLVNQNKETTNLMLDRIEKRQSAMYDLLVKIRE